MPYEKQNFKKGQVLKAEHLNKIEEGIANIDAKCLPAEEIQAMIDESLGVIENGSY